MKMPAIPIHTLWQQGLGFQSRFNKGSSFRRVLIHFKMTCLLVNSFGAIRKASFDHAGAVAAFCAAVPALVQGLEIAESFPKATFFGRQSHGIGLKSRATGNG